MNIWSFSFTYQERFSFIFYFFYISKFSFNINLFQKKRHFFIYKIYFILCYLNKCSSNKKF